MIKRITKITPNHYSEFQDQSQHYALLFLKSKQSLGRKGMSGGRISDTLLSQLQLDPARINQE